MRSKVAAQRHLAQVIAPAEGCGDPRTDRLRVGNDTTQFDAEVVAVAVVRIERSRVVVIHVQQQDVGVAVIVEIGAYDAPALLRVIQTETCGVLGERAIPRLR